MTDRYLYATFPLYKQIPGSSIKINVKKGLSTGAIAGIVIGIIVFIIILSIVIVYFIKRKKKKINIIPVNIDIDKEKEPKEVYNISEPLTIENLSEYILHMILPLILIIKNKKNLVMHLIKGKWNICFKIK